MKEPEKLSGRLVVARAHRVVENEIFLVEFEIVEIGRSQVLERFLLMPISIRICITLIKVFS